jgi:hypothetical protein
MKKDFEAMKADAEVLYDKIIVMPREFAVLEITSALIERTAEVQNYVLDEFQQKMFGRILP